MMADIFENISGNMEENSTSIADNAAQNSKNVSSTPSGSKPDEPKDRRSKSKDSSSSSSKSSSSKTLEKLTEVMASGFKDLKDLLKEQHLQNSRLYQEADYEYYDEMDELEDDVDMFDNFADGMTAGESVGPDVRGSLAGLTDNLLRLKIGDSVVKAKRELYPKPNNVKFLNAPKINKPMWDNLHYSTQVGDSQMQAIEKDFLASAIPTIKVMEKIFEAKDNMGSLKAVDLIDTLKDSLIFLGCANANMIKLRRENVKRVLPKHMQGLCSDNVEYSSSHLFGDDLNASIKEVSEFNKISNSFKARGGPSRGGRRAPLRGNRGRIYSRGRITRRPFRRQRPYDGNVSNNRKPLNRQSPSMK